MEFSDKGIKLLMELEGFKRHPYLDIAGLLTIGVGHLLTSQEKDRGFVIINGEQCYYIHTGLTEVQVRELLRQDCASRARSVNRYVHVPLTQNQFDAIVCFVFNIGTAAFSTSTLLRELNAGRYENVPTQMARWNRAGGAVQQGLINRREREISLFLLDNSPEL